MHFAGIHAGYAPRGWGTRAVASGASEPSLPEILHPDRRCGVGTPPAHRHAAAGQALLFASDQNGGHWHLPWAALHDPATGPFIPTGDMTSASEIHTATLLRDGRVLIARGAGAALATAEIHR